MFGKRYALCIGINEYQDSSLNLNCARNDAGRVGEVLEDKLRGDFEVQTLFDTEATKANILGAFNKLLQNPNLQSNSLILVYFAGHSNLDNKENLYLCPYDGACHPENQSANIGTMIHIKELEPSLDITKAETVVLIFDSCRSGAAGKLLGRIKYNDSSNIIVVGAARSSETAKEYRQGGYGRFTYYFLQALNERPISGEFITLNQILGFVQRGLERHGFDQKLQFAGCLITPEIPITKNPSYSLVSKEFTEEVKKCFELAGYYILSMPEDEDYPNFFTVKRQSGFEKSRTLVLCLDNACLNLSNIHIDQFISNIGYKREEKEIDRGIIVTRNDIPEDLQRKVASSGIVQWETYNSLIQNLIDFEDCRNKLIRDFEESDPDNPYDPPLARYYVDLKAERTAEIGSEFV
ncbi:MAG: caspase family protein, partial [Candidatus Desantisbacteria bacterium]